MTAAVPASWRRARLARSWGRSSLDQVSEHSQTRSTDPSPGLTDLTQMMTKRMKMTWKMPMIRLQLGMLSRGSRHRFPSHPRLQRENRKDGSLLLPPQPAQPWPQSPPYHSQSISLVPSFAFLRSPRAVPVLSRHDSQRLVIPHQSVCLSNPAVPYSLPLFSVPSASG